MTTLTDPGIALAIAKEFLNTDTPTDAQVATVRGRLGKVETNIAQDAYADVVAAQALLGARVAEWRAAIDAPAKRTAITAAIAQLDRMIRQLGVVRDRLTDHARRLDEGNG